MLNRSSLLIALVLTVACKGANTPPPSVVTDTDTDSDTDTDTDTDSDTDTDTDTDTDSDTDTDTDSDTDTDVSDSVQQATLTGDPCAQPLTLTVSLVPGATQPTSVTFDGTVYTPVWTADQWTTDVTVACASDASCGDLELTAGSQLVVVANAVDDRPSWYADLDDDGFGTVGAVTVQCDQPAQSAANDTDCDDAEPSVNPGRPEVCSAWDDDCDTNTTEPAGFYVDGQPGAATLDLSTLDGGTDTTPTVVQQCDGLGTSITGTLGTTGNTFVRVTGTGDIFTGSATVAAGSSLAMETAAWEVPAGTGLTINGMATLTGVDFTTSAAAPAPHALVVSGVDSELAFISGSVVGFGDGTMRGAGINVSVGGTVSVGGGSDTVLFQGNHSSNGGAIAVADGALRILAARFDSNTAESNGGALYLSALTSDSSLSNVEFVANRAGMSGGAIRAAATDVSLENATFTGNVASSRGGAVSSGEGTFPPPDAFDGDLTVTGTSSFTNNHAGLHGGAIHMAAGGTTELAGTYSDNHADSMPTSVVTYVADDGVGDGGAVMVSGGVVDLGGASFQNNSAENGGSVYADGGLTLSGTVTVQDSLARNDGGGLWLSGPTLDVGGTVMNNVAGRDGGGLHVTVQGGSSATVDAGVSNNHARENGGGMWLDTDVAVDVRSTWSNNHANSGATVLDTSMYVPDTDALGDGGALYVMAGEVAFNGVTLANNSAENGGGVFSADGLTFEGANTVSQNVARVHGGGLHTAGSITVGVGAATDSLLVEECHAAGNGGGIYTTAAPVTTGTLTLNNNHADSELVLPAVASDFSASAGGDGVGNGGGAYIVTTSDMTLELDAMGNTGYRGGGLWVSTTGFVDLNSTMTMNSAYSQGGALFFGGAGTVGVAGVWTENSARTLLPDFSFQGSGSAVYVDDSNARLCDTGSWSVTNHLAQFGTVWSDGVVVLDTLTTALNTSSATNTGSDLHNPSGAAPVCCTDCDLQSDGPTVQFGSLSSSSGGLDLFCSGGGCSDIACAFPSSSLPIQCSP